MGKPYVAFLWHHHQPPYRAHGELVLPWVRLHAARDYYQMASLVACHPDVHLTFNLTPALLVQFDAYLAEGARDRLMSLSLREPQRLAAAERDTLIASSFDVSFENVIEGHPRYRELYEKLRRGEPFAAQEVTDAVALFNLAWTGEIFREGPLVLETGAVVDLSPLFAKGRGYSSGDVAAIIAAQLEIMRAVVPLYRRLYHQGHLELATTPFYHPILPLLHDTDLAYIARPGASPPPRFAWPEDAREQVARAARLFREKFGRPPAGMWPAEGAVSEEVVPYFEEAGVRWLASDEGVLARSGPSGFDVRRPEVLSRPYRVGAGDVVAFFRHRGLSDALGFTYGRWPDARAAAADFVARLGAFLDGARRASVRDALVTVVLDGENAWGGYRRQGVPFLDELYRLLARGDVARAVTFEEYLGGAASRDIAPHPPRSLARAAPLACGSWVGRAGSTPGADLGMWLGGAEENRAWELLGRAREDVARAEVAAAARLAAREHLLAAETSDWFWWLGADAGGGADATFDYLFRENVAAAYRALGREAPAALAEPIAARRLVWRRERPLVLRRGDLLVVEWPEAGDVRFGVNGWQEPRERPLVAAAGAMAAAGSDVYRAPLLHVGAGVWRVEFTFRGPDGAWLGYDFFVPVA